MKSPAHCSLRFPSTLLLITAACWLAVLSVRAADRVAWTSNHVIGSPNPPAPYTVERIFPEVTFQNPVEFAYIPGTHLLMVADRSGKLWSLDTQSKGSQPVLALDIRSFHQPLDNVIGFAFHPGFTTNRFIFINYNEPRNRPEGAHVSRFKVNTDNPPTIDPKSEQVIIRWPGGGHNGCTVLFGPDGYLYISAGDSADPDPPDTSRTGQDISDLLADIMRIDVDHPADGKPYAIPQDNPFIHTPGARPEVWAFGLRNPFRMKFGPDGALWVGDVGWEQWEMIYRVKRGGNYGWSLHEGPNTHVRTDVAQGPGPILPPMISLPHSEAASITGGLVYQGKQLPKLRGLYIYGDWETGKFWAMKYKGDKMLANDELCDTTLKPISFLTGVHDDLMVLDYNGGIYRLVPNSAPAANAKFPKLLSKTGVFRELRPLTPADGVVAYQPNAGMWNDYATASWLLGVPCKFTITTANGRQTIAGRMWDFPTNTVFARTLTMEMEQGNPASARHIETQLFHFDGQQWNPYTYRWNEAQTDAALVPATGSSETLTVKDARAPGGHREIPWRFLSRAECLRCHNSWASETLSFNWLQLGNGNGHDELSRLASTGVLQIKDAPKNLAALVNPHDTTQPLDTRARSWLHVNCSGCHRYGAGGAVAVHLNFDKPVNQWRAVDEPPTRGSFELPAARIIAPGAPYRSSLFYRVNTEGAGRMPHIGSRAVDESGLHLLRDWIKSMPAPANPAADVAAAGKIEQNNTKWLALYAKTGDSKMGRQLLDTTSGSLRFLNEVSDASLQTQMASLAAAHTNALVRDLFQRLLPPEQRRHTLGSDINPQDILALRGNATRGRNIFLNTAQCARCHICQGIGRAFGPDLSGIGRKYPRAELLTQILEPSKFILPDFQTSVVVLKDESELSGFILKRSPTELLLKDENLAEHRLTPGDITAVRKSAISAMPEGMLAALTAQEAADLLEFLAKSTAPQSTKH